MLRSSYGVYRTFSRFSWPRSYAGKLLAAAFVCVHLPLIVLIGFVLAQQTAWALVWPLLLAVLLATLGGTAVLMVLLYGLLAPVRHATQALEAYYRDGTVPSLPTDYTDEAGQLMRSTQNTLTQLDSLLQLRARLLGVLSHDLRTPLATIQLATDLMTDELAETPPDTAMMAELATTMHTSIRHANQLTTSLLDAAQQGATLALRPETLSTTEVLARVVANVGLIARRKGVALSMDDQAQETLCVDGSKLSQVLLNFATNAIKFTPRGGHVSLTATREGDAFVFGVRDTGAGFDARDTPRLFEAFGEVQTTGTEGEAGHGLGLWIARTFAERLGGTVRATSVPGEGSVFSLVLPRAATGRAYAMPLAA